MANYSTQLDEIDQWLADNFGILPGACSSTENLRHNAARMIAEALWPKWKESLHIPEISKENGDSFTDETDSKKDSGTNDFEEAAEEYADGIIMRKDALMCKAAFMAGAEWQRDQDFTHHEADESLQEAVTHQMEDEQVIDDYVRRGLDDIVLKYAQLGANWQREQDSHICYQCEKE